MMVEICFAYHQLRLERQVWSLEVAVEIFLETHHLKFDLSVAIDFGVEIFLGSLHLNLDLRVEIHLEVEIFQKSLHLNLVLWVEIFATVEFEVVESQLESRLTVLPRPYVEIRKLVEISMTVEF